MQPTTRGPEGSSSANPEQIEAAVVERFLISGETVEEIAAEFGVSEAMVRASIGRAAQTALNRRGRPSSPALRSSLTPPLGWFDVPPDTTEPELRAVEDTEAEHPAEADGLADVERAPVGQGDADVPPAAQLVERAMRSVANGTPVTAVARWFNVPESELRAWIRPSADPPSADQPSEVVDAEPTPSSPRPAADPEPVADPEPPAAAEPSMPQAPNPTYDRNSADPDRVTRPFPSARRVSTVYSPNRAVVTGRRSSHPSPMSLRDSLQVLRRRLLIVLALVVLGASAGWVSAPGKASGHVTYRATHTLIYEPRGSQIFNIQQVALLATSGDVPSRVAARLKLDRAQVRSAVSAVANPDVSTISITGRSADAAGAVSLADVTADELTIAITGPDQAAYDAQIKQLTGQVDSTRARLNATSAKDAAGLAAARADVASAEQALQQYKSSTPPPNSQLRTLETASASAVKPAGVKAPNSKKGRALLLGGIGLLVGIAGAFALDRLDSRIRSKRRAEEAFGAPVVAEVPPLAKSLQDKLLTSTEATSPFVEAYRGLRTYVALWAPETGEDDGHRVILVTSPGPSEGKTTTVAHLAAMLAEIGRSVVVISADLRRPRLHTYFDVPAGPGLVEALAASEAPDFETLLRATSVRGVQLVPSGSPVDNPAPLLEHAADLLQSIRPLADFVLIDCPPLLVANDAVEMARHADGVLLVARSGATPVEAAERSAELLERLDIPVVGAVLVGSEAVSDAARYYTSRYYAEPERSGLLRRRSSDGNGERSAPETPADRR
jgi:capsular exopolysaccharide synthesis family protein